MSKGTRMRLVIDKQPEGTKSPNLADAVVMAYWPADASGYELSVRVGAERGSETRKSKIVMSKCKSMPDRSVFRPK